ncbi:photosynthetic NDH subunit of lumenal location 3, chloroplastic [Cornus florida]|uniref:photosynthetic NDH subunit of lumenal location 3, chloroplastic n=1 Tax=Cornus florida TaxID=4283 RepID=UPI00289D3CCE|nr:photosynthetic NDH subunit of lumenal location 3, chloroplastic [Cornus florida]
MARLTNLNGIFEALPAIPKLPNIQSRPPRKRATILECRHSNKNTEQEIQVTRRIALGLSTSVAVFGSWGIGISLADDNTRLWLDGPLPVPPVYNKMANEETGTRSFLKKGIYIANIGIDGSAYRLRKYAFDLLALGDLIGHDAWDHVRRYLHLKSTFMYYDFDKLISAAPLDDKKPLSDLANTLFDRFEKLDDALKKHNLPLTESCYQETSSILQEVMDRMA